MKRTNKYSLAYFEHGDTTSAKNEAQRWLTLDAQLESLFRIIGNGVIRGWNIQRSSGLSCVVHPGSGHVGFVSVESSDPVELVLVENSINYIYARLNPDSYWTKSVSFDIYLNRVGTDDEEKRLLIGIVYTNVNRVTTIDQDLNNGLGFSNMIDYAVASHRHDGSIGNPDPIDLGSEVTGKLSIEHFPDLDASLIKSGKLDLDVIPKIDHIKNLKNQGVITHAQLDAYVEMLNVDNQVLMGDISTSNLLELIVSLKYIYPNIDDYLYNQFTFIPGVSSNEYIDFENTTAIVDTRTSEEGGTHTISGSSATKYNSYTKSWVDFSYNDLISYNNIVIVGGKITNSASFQDLIIDRFSDLSEWQVNVSNLSKLDSTLLIDNSNFKVLPQSGKLSVVSKSVEVKLLLEKRFDPSNWSDYSFLTFNLYTKNVNHGDLYFYINDAFFGSQSSEVMVLRRNALTVNEETLLPGWQEVIIDLTLLKRTSINAMGFYVSTNGGWNTSQDFDLNIDNFKLNSGNIYARQAFANIIYESDTPVIFSNIRWDANVPDDDTSVGTSMLFRTRLSDTVLDLNDALWSPYFRNSGFAIENTTSNELKKVIEIEFSLYSSSSLKRAPVLSSIYLDYQSVSDENSVVFLDRSNWNNGKFYNLEFNSIDNSVSIRNNSDINSLFLNFESEIKQYDSELNLNKNMFFSSLPLSTNQSLSNKTSGLGFVTSIVKGSDNTFWLSDLENDRVVEIDMFGNLITCLQGSFLYPPIDYYGVEDNGLGSNITSTVAPYSLRVKEDDKQDGEAFRVLHSIYNDKSGLLYVIFNKNLENIYDISSANKIKYMYLKLGSHRIWLYNSHFQLFNVSEEKYNEWISAYALRMSPAYNPESVDLNHLLLINQFKFTSHILQFKILGSEKTVLDSLLDIKPTRIAIVTPYNGQILDVNEFLIEFLIENNDSFYINGISVVVDGVEQIVYSYKVLLTDLTFGIHNVQVSVLGEDGQALENPEASAHVSFFVNDAGLQEPSISIVSPVANQSYSTGYLSVKFSVSNVFLSKSSYFVQYRLDNLQVNNVYDENLIIINNIVAGKHTIKMWLVDSYGVELDNIQSQTSCVFFVGKNLNGYLTLHVDSDAVSDIDGHKLSSSQNVLVDIANVYFANIYSPLDLQLIPIEDSVDGSGFSILVSKLRSESSCDYLSTATEIAEINARLSLIESKTQEQRDAVILNPNLSHVAMTSLIYGSKYLDGHSVVQFSMDGKVVFSNNAAVFANNKDQAKEILGSANKIGRHELLVADSINKRAIIVFEGDETNIVWEYTSDRNVVDFQLNTQDERFIYIYDDHISSSFYYLRQGMKLTWRNLSSNPLTIYSGDIDVDNLQGQQTLNIYGDIFKSNNLNVNEEFSFVFNNSGDFYWFSYPNILKGTIKVSQQRLSNLDQFYILESDGLDSPFSSRLIKVDSWGNILWSFGEGYLVKPRDIRPLLNNRLLIST